MDYRNCSECTEKNCFCERVETHYGSKQKEIERIKFMGSLEANFNPEISH